MRNDLYNQARINNLRDELPPKGSRIHFIGIGGSSMSGLALIARHLGYTVTGSDSEWSKNAQTLIDQGIKVALEQNPDNVDDGIALVVYTIAVRSDNPEFLEVRRRKIPCVERGHFLGIISSLHKYTVSVSGTHGKTTTTGMLGSILLETGFDPAIHIGGYFPVIGGSVRPSDSEYFITEACEYHAHMLEIPSFGAIILNVESEHLDYYGNDDNIDAAFANFAGSVSKDGFVVVHAENPRAMKAASSSKAKVVTYALCDSGLNAEFEAYDICCYPDKTEYTLLHSGEKICRITLKVPGFHNVMNSVAAAAAAWNLGAGPESIMNGLIAFSGTGRRFERKGTVRGASLIDDYAHHPTEVKATLEAALSAKQPEGRLIAIFQVHTYTRARDFGEAFADALRLADEVIVSDIFAAREKDLGDVSGKTLTDLFVSRGLKARYISSFYEIAKYVSSVIKPGDMVITLGAGDINKVLPMIR